MAQLTFPLDNATKAIVFDKDGTLIDFDAMWGSWMIGLIGQLEQASNTSFAARFWEILGYDPTTSRMSHRTGQTSASLEDLHTGLITLMCEAGADEERARQALKEVWHLPDPVKSLVPITDLKKLFEALRAKGYHLAIATVDNQASAATSMDVLGVRPYLDMIIGGDTMPSKPAPDAILAVCDHLRIQPSEVVMVGDSPVDMLMGRAAGAGLCIGVTSGAHSAEELSQYADLVLGSVAELISA
jgi:haloacid dehalogenase superfamily, subfamily IA, variant 3 with third motif having DD or ED/haloacid dehalogenase superfamily, subfamily IA, variant 1 with third motif having Dx(3-4)D or Dx(3-4)E